MFITKNNKRKIGFIFNFANQTFRFLFIFGTYIFSNIYLGCSEINFIRAQKTKLTILGFYFFICSK